MINIKLSVPPKSRVSYLQLLNFTKIKIVIESREISDHGKNFKIEWNRKFLQKKPLQTVLKSESFE